jgi:hypothetical protein
MDLASLIAARDYKRAHQFFGVLCAGIAERTPEFNQDTKNVICNFEAQ